MTARTRHAVFVTAATLLMAVPGTAAAQEHAGPAQPPDATASGVNPEGQSALFGDAKALPTDALAALAGGQQITLGDLALNLSGQNGEISDTQMTGDFMNGEIGANTFEQISGINSFLFNTGNNVNLQSSIQVNVYVN